MMDGAAAVEEAHGLWELAVQRVAALAEAFESTSELSAAQGALFSDAIRLERQTFDHWRRVSNLVTQPELTGPASLRFESPGRK